MGIKMLLDILILERTAFLAHCEKIRGLSKNSVDAYEQDIAAFVGFFRKGNPSAALDLFIGLPPRLPS